MKNIFDKTVSTEVVNRIQSLTADTKPVWGTMSVDKMLAHCNVTYEFLYDNIHAKPNGVKKFILKLFVKNIVVSEKPYKKSSQTAPEFIIKDNKNFEQEKKRLVDYINKTQQLGEAHFDGKESHSFGTLNKTEWNNMFYKHLDHHLSQFGV
ncbi:MAG: hypothetical protein RJA07_2005 [Bacteroidota bacterium]|jgi:hypothetical protein